MRVSIAGVERDVRIVARTDSFQVDGGDTRVMVGVEQFAVAAQHARQQGVVAQFGIDVDDGVGHENVAVDLIGRHQFVEPDA